jgi:tRNA-binding EMAP/Myf-like protein
MSKLGYQRILTDISFIKLVEEHPNLTKLSILKAIFGYAKITAPTFKQIVNLTNLVELKISKYPCI